MFQSYRHRLHRFHVFCEVSPLLITRFKVFKVSLLYLDPLLLIAWWWYDKSCDQIANNQSLPNKYRSKSANLRVRTSSLWIIGRSFSFISWFNVYFLNLAAKNIEDIFEVKLFVFNWIITKLLLLLADFFSGCNFNF